MIKRLDQPPALTEPSPSGRGQGEGCVSVPHSPPKRGGGYPHPDPLPEGEGMTRRRVAILLGATGALATLGLPRAVFAAAPTEKRLVVRISVDRISGMGPGYQNWS